MNNWILTLLFLFGLTTGTAQQSRVKIIGDTAIIANNIDTAIHLAQQGYRIFYVIQRDSSPAIAAKFKKIPKKQLYGFACDNCHLKELPRYFTRFKNLHEVEINWYLFKDYPYETSAVIERVLQLQSLRKLIVHGLPVRQIEKINSLHLTYLKLTSCGFQTFPTAIYKLERLQNLRLGCNEIKEVPDGLAQLKELNTLHFDGGACGGNPLEYITPELLTLSQLKTFSASYAHLKILPKDFFTLPNLQDVHLWYAGLKTLPEVPFGTQLSRFVMAENKGFQEFPSSFFRLNVKERPDIDVYQPQASVIKSRYRVAALEGRVPEYELSLRGDYMPDDDIFRSYRGFWELESASDGSNQIELLPGLPDASGKYLDTRNIHFLLGNIKEGRLGKDYWKKKLGANLRFNPMVTENVFFGQVQSYEFDLFDPVYTDEFVYFEAELLDNDTILKVTNKIGVVYRLRRVDLGQ
ncbi:MAG: hypothetical protein AAGI23_03510 [Bacteroidota bacterium]